MPSEIKTQSDVQCVGPAPTQVIESRHQYRPCHIRVPDLEQPVPAICVDDEYYSLFKTVKDGEKTLEIVAKLGSKGDRTVITKTAQGYVIWVREPEASPSLSS